MLINIDDLYGKSFVATGKSPCYKCEHIKQDKNFEPCNSCKLPSQYDDRISPGPKRFTPATAIRGTVSPAKDKVKAEAKRLGFVDVKSYIDFLRDDGASYEHIGELIGVSRGVVKRCLNEKY